MNEIGRGDRRRRRIQTDVDVSRSRFENCHLDLPHDVKGKKWSDLTIWKIREWSPIR